jgi:hypothetical protein
MKVTIKLDGLELKGTNMEGAYMEIDLPDWLLEPRKEDVVRKSTKQNSKPEKKN